jgi:hypothetical protein
VQVSSTFKDLQNGAANSGDNFQGGSGTTSTVQSEGRIFFNAEVDSVEIASVSWNDYVIIELYSRCYGVLPVNWLHFSGHIINGMIQLNWSTASETGNKNFVIQKLTGNNWTDIGTIAGAGMSNLASLYNFTDAHTQNGNNTYRIKQINIDGTYSFSNSTTILFRTTRLLKLFPNPASSACYIESSSLIVKADIISADGKTLLTKTADNLMLLQLDIRSLPKGCYIVRVSFRDHSTQFQKLLVQ